VIQAVQDMTLQDIMKDMNVKNTVQLRIPIAGYRERTDSLGKGKKIFINLPINKYRVEQQANFLLIGYSFYSFQRFAGSLQTNEIKKITIAYPSTYYLFFMITTQR
jgi:hypothetical protein